MRLTADAIFIFFDSQLTNNQKFQRNFAQTREIEKQIEWERALKVEGEKSAALSG